MVLDFQLDPTLQPEGPVIIRLESQPRDRWQLQISGSDQFDQFGFGNKPLAEFSLDEQMPEDVLKSLAEQWRGMLWAVPFVRAGVDEAGRSRMSLEITGVPLADCPKCPDCAGRGQYVGFLEVEPCQPCAATGRRPNVRGVEAVFAVGRPL